MVDQRPPGPFACKLARTTYGDLCDRGSSDAGFLHAVWTVVQRILLVVLELFVAALIVAPRWIARKLATLIRAPARRVGRSSPTLAASGGGTSLTGRSVMSKNSTIVVCPNCGRKNRVLPSTSGVPRCSVCHTLLPWIVEADRDTFEQELHASVPVLVDFWAPWCGPCRMVSPLVERVGREHAGQLKVVKLNIDAAQLSDRYDSRHPTAGAVPRRLRSRPAGGGGAPAATERVAPATSRVGGQDHVGRPHPLRSRRPVPRLIGAALTRVLLAARSDDPHHRSLVCSAGGGQPARAVGPPRALRALGRPGRCAGPLVDAHGRDRGAPARRPADGVPVGRLGAETLTSIPSSSHRPGRNRRSRNGARSERTAAPARWSRRRPPG